MPSKMLLLLAICCLLLGACQSVMVPVTHMRAAEGSIPSDVRKIAILPYDYDEGTLNPAFNYLKNTISDKVAQEITKYGTYGVAERVRVKALMQEAMVSAGTVMNEETMANVAKRAESQAIVMGRVTNVVVEESMINKEVTLESKDPDLPPQTRIYPWLVRRVSLNVTSEMLHVTTKQKIVTHVFSHTYDSEKDKKVKGGFFTNRNNPKYYQNQRARVPSVATILGNLAQKCAYQFIKKISAHPISFKLAIKDGDSPAMKSGLEWVKTQQYDRALEEYKKATSHPQDSAAAWYNIGVCQEALKRPGEALKAYDQANKIRPSAESKKGVARIREFYPGL